MTIRPSHHDDTGPQAADLSRCLRAWSLSSWEHGSRIDATRSVLEELAVRASATDGRPRPLVPDAGVHALADQLQVLTEDAINAGVAGEEVAVLLADLVRNLGLTVR